MLPHHALINAGALAKKRAGISSNFCPYDTICRTLHWSIKYEQAQIPYRLQMQYFCCLPQIHHEERKDATAVITLQSSKVLPHIINSCVLAFKVMDLLRGQYTQPDALVKWSNSFGNPLPLHCCDIRIGQACRDLKSWQHLNLCLISLF